MSRAATLKANDSVRRSPAAPSAPVLRLAASRPATTEAAPCVRCLERPRLGSLTRCKACLQAAAEADRQTRAEAEARVKARTETEAPPATKACRTCKIEKPFSSFSRHRLSRDGHRHDCRHCVKQGRAATKPRPPAQVEKAKVAAAKPERRAANRIAVADWSSRHPLAARARQVLRRAIKSGRISPPATCQVEGCEDGPVVAHHPDYLKPLQVLFACRRHHRLLHNGVILQVKAGVPRKLKRVPKTRKAA